jgi:membrane protease YdiL (CAAX protease family)
MGQPLLAWLVILGLVGFIIYRHATSRPESRQADQVVMVEGQARYMVGAATVLHGQEKILYDKASEFNRGSYAQRLRYVILGGDLVGPAEARDRLQRLAAGEDNAPAPTPKQQRLTELLLRLYTAYEAGHGPEVLSAEEQAEVRESLGWFGALALTPAGHSTKQERARVVGPAQRTAVGLIGYTVGMILLAGVGLLLGVAVFVLWLLGRLRAGFRPGSPYGGIYAETFALYLVLFVAAGFAFRWLQVRQDLAILFNGLAALVGLVALAWPVLRGVSWQQVRIDIGWRARRPGREILLGLGCYVTALPVMFGGVLVFVLLTHLLRQLGKEPEPPDHPLIGWVAHGGWWVRLQVAFDACVVAPLVEETMFRGVFYRHLREATGRLLPVLSVLASAVVVSLLFAAIHPQGLVFVPVLGGLAFVFCMAREWRGSLLAPIVAHGINNGVTLLLLLLLVG